MDPVRPITQQLALYERIELLHRRIDAFLGPEWGEQLIIALNNIAMTSTQSYVDLLEEAAATVVREAR